MIYTLKWQCSLCHRAQASKIETGRGWPTVCPSCKEKK